jgi:hypothetical protein
MSWKIERDSLIAQTMAFVQSVTGRKEVTVPPVAGFTSAAQPAELLTPTALDVWAAPTTIAPIEPVKAAEPQPAITASALRPVVAGEVANEIRARVAGFRVHQERFNREREEYFSQTLAKLKAQISEMPPPTRPDK